MDKRRQPRGSVLLQQVEQEVHEQVRLFETGINECMDEECAVVQHEGDGGAIDLEGLQALTCVAFLAEIVGA